jgi:hypothetical protein
LKNPFQFVDDGLRLMTNSLGYQQLTTTLTAVGRKVSEQKYYSIPFADYVPVVLGNGTYKRSILNWRTFLKGEGFKSGIISNAGNQSRLDLVDAAYDGLTQNILNWAKATQYNVFELQEAMQAGTIFSLIEAREKARAMEWQLGLQEVAFKGIGAEKGLLNLSGVTSDNTNLTGWIKDLSADNFNTFVGKVYGLYRYNTNYTAKPTHFIMPETDFNGLINYPSATYPLKTKLDLLTEAFRTITGNASFKVLPCAYCDKANFDTTNNMYVMLNYAEDTLKLDIPLDLTTTAAGTLNGFNFENVGYGQFTGVIALRPLEIYYFYHTGSI